MAFPAETIDGRTVQIAEKHVSEGEVETFIDVDGNRYTRKLTGGALKLIPETETTTTKLEEQPDGSLEEVVGFTPDEGVEIGFTPEVESDETTNLDEGSTLAGGSTDGYAPAA